MLCVSQLLPHSLDASRAGPQDPQQNPQQYPSQAPLRHLLQNPLRHLAQNPRQRPMQARRTAWHLKSSR